MAIACGSAVRCALALAIGSRGLCVGLVEATNPGERINGSNRGAAQGVRRSGSTPPYNSEKIENFEIKLQDALALHKQAVLRLWGLTAQWGWARLILNRLRGLIVLSEPPDAPEGDPDADAHDHHTFFPRPRGVCRIRCRLWLARW